METLFGKLFCVLSVLILTGFYACTPAHRSYPSPKGYDLNHPEKFNMPESLHEISGIAFHHHKSDKVYSIQDEEGRFYRQGWQSKKQKHVTFADKGDFEDLAILNETVVVLKSDGHLYTFPFSEAKGEEVKDVKEWKDILPKGEYESIYADEQTNQLYLLCKNCKEDKKNQIASGSVFTYDAEKKDLISSGHFSINLSKLIAEEKILKTGLKASALTRNLHTGEWYILSSVNKLLLITTPDWQIKSTYRLDSSIFGQPEGITFDDQMNLFISNEGDEFSTGNILKFTYKP